MQCKKFTSPPVFGAVLQFSAKARQHSRPFSIATALLSEIIFFASGWYDFHLLSSSSHIQNSFVASSYPFTAPEPSTPDESNFWILLFLKSKANPKQITLWAILSSQGNFRHSSTSSPSIFTPQLTPNKSLKSARVASNSSHQSLPPPALKQSVLLQNIFINYGKYKRISLQKTITLTHPRRHRLKIAFCKTSSQR